MTGVEEEDWTEMVQVLRETEQSIAALSDGDFATEIERSRKCLLAFHSTAGMLGLTDLEKAGVMLEKYLTTQVNSSTSMDTLSAFGFAVSILADQVKEIGGGKGSGEVDFSEIIEILGPEAIQAISALILEEKPANAQPEVKRAVEPKVEKVEPKAEKIEAKAEKVEPKAEKVAPKAETVEKTEKKELSLAEKLGQSHFAEVMKSLGGELTVSPNGKSDQFTVTFTGNSESLEQLDSILAGNGTSSEPRISLDNKLQKIITRGKEFMAAFSTGDMPKAQEVLQSLADQPPSAGLYKEIGTLARGLHDSIRSFLSTMDPSLMDMVEDKIPDSGNRLEHMLQLMEKAAMTTLDHVDAIQERLEGEEKQIARLRQLLSELKPIGNQAISKINESSNVLDGLDTIISGNQADLNIILTAQDYQDLSGQIVQKITVLLKELELKLVNMIRTFGVKGEAAAKKESSDTLYGPAHQARDDSVHSQDEVDSLLAEFGF